MAGRKEKAVPFSRVRTAVGAAAASSRLGLATPAQGTVPQGSPAQSPGTPGFWGYCRARRGCSEAARPAGAQRSPRRPRAGRSRAGVHGLAQRLPGTALCVLCGAESTVRPVIAGSWGANNQPGPHEGPMAERARLQESGAGAETPRRRGREGAERRRRHGGAGAGRRAGAAGAAGAAAPCAGARGGSRACGETRQLPGSYFCAKWLSRPALLLFLVQGGLGCSETTPVGWPGCSVTRGAATGHLKGAEMSGERHQSRS